MLFCAFSCLITQKKQLHLNRKQLCSSHSVQLTAQKRRQRFILQLPRCTTNESTIFMQMVNLKPPKKTKTLSQRICCKILPWCKRRKKSRGNIFHRTVRDVSNRLCGQQQHNLRSTAVLGKVKIRLLIVGIVWAHRRWLVFYDIILKWWRLTFFKIGRLNLKEPPTWSR